jgi:hypothetical protein
MDFARQPEYESFMKTITVPAKINGAHIDPIEPLEIPANARVFILVATPGGGEEVDDGFREDWQVLSEASLARAYGEDEPEYDLTMLKAPNPDYEPR